MKLGDKVCVITGAASGIGRAMAQRFATEGARAVVVADRDEAGAVAVAEEIGSVARGVGLDVADEAAIQALVAETEASSGPIDVFASNAGYAQGGGLNLSNEDWQRMMDVHFTSHLYAARAVVPAMVAKGDGYIVNTASAAGLLTQMDSGPYAVSKHAAVAFAEWLSINYGDRGVRVSVLCPQLVRTNIVPGLDKIKDGRDSQAGQDGIVEPEDLAGMVVEAMDEERFLILPHPQVETYMQRKTSDYDRWLAGMRRFRARLSK